MAEGISVRTTPGVVKKKQKIVTKYARDARPTLYASVDRNVEFTADPRTSRTATYTLQSRGFLKARNRARITGATIVDFVRLMYQTAKTCIVNGGITDEHVSEFNEIAANHNTEMDRYGRVAGAKDVWKGESRISLDDLSEEELAQIDRARR